MANENRCICCGAIIPEGRHVCLLCERGNDMQTFKPRSEKIEKDCSNCKYAKIGGAGKSIRTHGNSIFIMEVTGGGTHCAKGTIKNLTITDGKMICSEYEPKEGADNDIC